LWIVGNIRRFNAQGRVPTNRTTLDVLKNGAEHRWNSAESIALLAAIAGLFHDFGKAGMCFQQTLRGKVSMSVSRTATSGSRFVCFRRLSAHGPMNSGWHRWAAQRR
jgi:hypothetical protein